MKLLIVFGTRPEAIKMAPPAPAPAADARFDAKVCVTGQHRQMLVDHKPFKEIAKPVGIVIDTRRIWS